MEAQGRSGSFGFPGYDGSLPRAVRSSRGRGEGLRKPKDASKSMGFFELLATVAGQLLQEADKDELQKANLLGNHELAKGKTVDKKESSSAEKQNDLLSEEQIGALLNELHRGGKLLENRIENGKSGPESNILQRRCTSGDKSIHHVTHYYQQEAGDTVNSPYKKCTSQKCTFGRGQKSQNVTHEDHLLPECEDCVEDVASSKIGLEKWAMSSKNLFQSLQNCREDASMSHVNQLTVSVQAEVAATKLSCGFIEFGKRKGESEHDYGSFGRWIKSEEDVGFIEQGGPTFDYENPPLVSSGSSSGEAPMCTERKTSEMDSNLLKERRTVRRQDVPHPTRSKAKARDNDENTSESTVPETAPKKTTLKLSHMKALKARKLGNAANRHELPGAGSKRKHSELEECSLEKDGRFHRVGKSHSRQRMTRFLAFKRKTVEGSSYDVPAWNLNTDGVASVENARVDGEPPASAAKLRSAKAASFSSSPTSPASPSLKERGKKSSEPHIKLSIKSFTVPEFSVDLPESATIANLKRAVMEAAMNLFGGGLHVRVLLQGKKVSDESASLLQVGISQSRKMDSLGFMLEPSPLPTSPMNSEDPFLVLSSAASQPTSRHSVLSMDGDVDQNTFKGHNGNSNGTVEANASNDTGLQADAVKVKSDLDPSSNCLNGSLVPESRAIILHPSIGVEGVQDFALVPVHPKSQNVEMGKRRMRRPFSVAEVEALVQAVEKLGTGRWRDVKLQAFDQAKHRTYVDLKDKWKTLVHTAQIAPHQRRGEPVPQELLDRVTWAHSYWTAQQAKQQAELGM